MSSAPFDSTLSLKRDPYRFISRTCAEIGTDALGTRLMLVTGPHQVVRRQC